jgi:PST family polysaccharide transporter
LALLFLTYADTIGDLGVAAAVIYWPERHEDIAGVSFWVGLAMSLAWFTLAQLTAAPVADFFRNPDAEPILRVLAWSFPLRALGNTHDALCQRALHFKARVVPETLLVAVKGIACVGLALAGFGVWSLVWGQLAGVAVRTVALWVVVPWRPDLRLSTSLLGPVLRYGRGIVAVRVLAAVLHHADVVIVGRILGVTALGFYQIAAKVPEMTVALLIWVGGKVLFPTLARVQEEPEQLRRVYLEALRWVGLLAIPASVGMFLLAEPLLVTLLGPTWASAAPILRALAVYTGLRALGSHAGDVLKATGRPGLLAGLGVAKAALLLPALVWAAGQGTATVAATMAAVTALTVSLNVGVVCRLLGIGPRSVLSSLLTALPPVLVMTPVLVAWNRIAAPLSPTLHALGGVGVGLVAYLGTLALTAPRLRQTLRSFALRQEASSPPADVPALGEGAR